MPKDPKTNSNLAARDELVQASYKAGHASGRLEAIEESMDAIVALIIKAEALQESVSEKANAAMQENARHTLQALHLAFAAVTDSVNGSAAFRELLEQSKQRLSNGSHTRH